MELSSIFGVDSTAGTEQLKEQLAAIKAASPTQAQLTLPELQQYVSAGILTPQQYQAVAANPQAYSDIIAQTDTSGTNAQKAALAQLGHIVQSGGSTPINQANLLNNINTTNQAMQGARQGIQENAQERGVSGGGLEFINQLMNEQANAQNANTGAVNAGANNAQLALNAIAQQGQLGGQLQGQSNQMSQAQAQAAQQIAQYNSQLQSQANQYNTQNANDAQAANLANAQGLSNQNVAGANQRSQYNAQIPETLYNNALGAQQAYTNQSNLAQQQAQNNNAFNGNLLGTAAKLGAAYMTGGASLALPSGSQGASAYGASQNAPGYAANSAANNPANLYGKNPNTGYAKGGEVKQPYQPMNPKLATGQIPGVPALPGMSHNDAEQYKQRMAAQKRPEKSQEQKELDGDCGPNLNEGGMCYAEGGEVHDHEICMKAGGPVPGDQSDMPMGEDSQSNDTVPAHLSPGEIVLPRSVTQSPDAPQQAQQFVSQTQGGSGMPQPNVNSFAEALAKLEANGLELRLAPKGA